MCCLAMIPAAVALAGCIWETYQNIDGHTSLWQRHEKGTHVYYQGGTYSRNMCYNQFRPEQYTIRLAMNTERDVRGTNWQKPQKQDETTVE